MSAMRRGLRPACLLLLLLAGCKTDLYTRLDEREANEMVAILLHGGIDADRAVAKDGTSSVEVEKERVADAVDLLEARRHPRERFETMAQVFAPRGLIASPVEERARYIYALGQEIERTLSDIDGVISARVQVVLPQNDPLGQASAPAAAAVFIRYDSAVDVPALLPQIKTTTANSIQGLAYDHVSVVLLPVASRAPDLLPAQRPAGSFPVAAAASVAALLLAAAGGGGWLWRRRARGGFPLPGRRAHPIQPAE